MNKLKKQWFISQIGSLKDQKRTDIKNLKAAHKQIDKQIEKIMKKMERK